MSKNNWWFFVSVIGLLGLGAISVMSGSAVISFRDYGDSYFFFKRHMIGMGIGFLFMLIVGSIDYHKLIKYSGFIYLFTLFLLILVFVPGIGVSVAGAHRWIKLPGFSFQPSELSKIALILYLVGFIERKREYLSNLKRGILPMFVLSLLMFLLVVVEPDLGVAFVLFLLFIVVVFVAGVSLKYVFSLMGIFVAGVLSLVFLGGYGKGRILSFLDPWKYRQGLGFQMVQSLIAFGMGGIWGMGLGSGRQKFLYLPAQQTDFVFTVVGEEMGMVGAVLVIVLYVILAYKGMKLAVNAPDMSGYLLAVGIVSAIIIQATVNMGMVLGLLPITGITLPFMSYGRSSMIVYMSMIGILINIGRQSLQ